MNVMYYLETFFLYISFFNLTHITSPHSIELNTILLHKGV